MRKLEEIVKDINDAYEAMNRDLTKIPIAGRTGFIMAANQAKQNMPALKKEYEQTLFNKSIVFFPEGTSEEQNKFAELAVKLGKAIIVDAKSMYRGYATLIAPTVGHHKQFTIQQLTKLEMLMQETCLLLNLERANYPVINGDNTVNTHDELVNFISRMVTESNGYNLTVPYLRNLISNRALDTKFNSKVLLVVVLDADENLQNNLETSFTKSFTTTLSDVEEDKQEDFVNKTLRSAFKN